MNFFDVLFRMDREGRLLDVRWGDAASRDMYLLLFENWIQRGKTAAAAFGLPADQERGTLQWDKDTFHFQQLPAPDGQRYLLLRRENHREYLFARALDQITEGIQIYDKDACAVYFNRASRGISHIPSGIDPAGRHLLDLYNLDEGTSTTITALRTRRPVTNRVDRFQASGNASHSIATANTSYPILKDGELLGAVVFEQTEEIAHANIQRLEETQAALSSYSSLASRISFSGYTFANVIGSSEKLRSAVSIAQKVAAQDCSILLVGETGTGKEIFAQSIHRSSPRSEKKFLSVNCAATPEEILEPLLFGSQDSTAGYFEAARGGTLFLDELTSLSLSMQSKLLRAIQDTAFRQDGGTNLAQDVRIICSCSEDPFRSIAENRFRRDLFYRLSTVMIDLPPLREHPEDLEELVTYHLNATSYHYVRGITAVDPKVYDVLRAYRWPGNVRELFHAIDYAQNVSDSTTLRVNHLPRYLTQNQPDAPGDAAPAGTPEHLSGSLQEMMDACERRILLRALEECGGNVSRAADRLGLLRQSLQYRLRKHGISAGTH